jgi:hypothetical protein
MLTRLDVDHKFVARKNLVLHLSSTTIVLLPKTSSLSALPDTSHVVKHILEKICLTTSLWLDGGSA